LPERRPDAKSAKGGMECAAVTMTEAEPFGAYAPRGLVRRAMETTRALRYSWVNRRVTNVLRRVALTRLRGAPVDVEALGFRMRLKPERNICEKRMLFSPQTFDPDELAILAARLRPGFVFIDIGANVGAYALFVASRTDGTSRVLALEPQPDIFDRLVFNIRLNSFATIKALNCAVADKSGEVTLFIDSDNSGESSVKLLGSTEAEPIRVVARTLLDVIEEERYPRVDAVKLDVEGAEDLILEPFFAKAPAALHPHLLIIENAVRQWQIDLPALLTARGYRRIARTRLNLVYERTTADGDAQHV
jgi:FkbM family methyltransferase